MRFLIALLILPMLAACDPLRGGLLPTLVRDNTAQGDHRYVVAQPFNLDTGKLPGAPIFPASLDDTTITHHTGFVASIANPKAGALAIDLARADMHYRNELQNDLISRSDAMCGLFKDRMHQSNAYIDFGLLTTAVSAAAASTVVTGRLGSEILAATSGVATSIVGLKDSSFLMNQLISTIFQQIDASRSLALQNIHNRQTEKVNVYSASRAISDAVRYHELCNLPPALAGLSDSIKTAYDQNTSTPTTEIIQRIQTLKSLSDANLITQQQKAEEVDEILNEQ